MIFKWNKNESFAFPKGLIRKGDFLIWKSHPWTNPKIQFPKAACSEAWSKMKPKTLREKESLAKVCPAAFLIFQLVPRKTWGADTLKVIPLMPIVKKLPSLVIDA